MFDTYSWCCDGVPQTSSSENNAQVSAEALLVLSEGVAKVRMALDTPHEALRNVSLTAEYRYASRFYR